MATDHHTTEAKMTGICMCCLQPAEATFANGGYSDCCNDRIAYGGEARQLVHDEIASLVAGPGSVQRDKQLSRLRATMDTLVRA